ncbi:hypothetical protein VW35_16055 [Devosia soli]|uniref:Integration host factor subunit alpha n=2 Tax=Devosia soli TaxID=361041 RepID=A0A0F5L5S8_9HYPH|nr:hypothetical protein VW35_16055 [Devosia soli]
MLAAAVAKSTGRDMKDVEHVVRRAIEIVAEALKSAENVKLAKFGTFSVVSRAERPGRNPRTLVEHKIPARKVVQFVPGKPLEDKLVLSVFNPKNPTISA